MSWGKNIEPLQKYNKYWVLGDQAVVSGAAFTTTILAAHGLGAREFGWFASVIMVQLFLLSVQSAIIISPYQVLQAEYSSDHKPGYISAVLVIQVYFLMLVAVLAVVLFFIRPLFMALFIKAWWWIVIAISGYLFQDYLRRFFTAEGKAFYAFMIDCITNVLQLTILVFLFFTRQLNFVNCFLVMGLTFIPSLVLGLYWYKYKRVALATIKVTCKEHRKHGKWLLATALLQWWGGNSFIVTAGLILGVQTFGALRLGQNIFGILNVLFQAFENHVLPNAARIYRQSATDLPVYLKRVSMKAAGLVAVVLMCVFIFARFIFSLIGGEQYVPYTGVLQGMCVVYLFVFLGYPIRIAIRVMLLNTSFFIGYCITAVFSLLSANAFIQYWGVAGVIAGLIINQLILVLFWIYILQRQTSLLWK